MLSNGVGMVVTGKWALPIYSRYTSLINALDYFRQRQYLHDVGSSESWWSLALMPTFIWWCLLVWGPIWLCQPSLLKRPSRRATVGDSLHFQPCFSPLFFWKKCIPGLRRRRSQTAFQPLHVFVCPLEAHWEGKQIASKCIWKWPHLLLLWKDSKNTTKVTT